MKFTLILRKIIPAYSVKQVIALRVITDDINFVFGNIDTSQFMDSEVEMDLSKFNQGDKSIIYIPRINNPIEIELQENGTYTANFIPDTGLRKTYKVANILIAFLNYLEYLEIEGVLKTKECIDLILDLTKNSTEKLFPVSSKFRDFSLENKILNELNKFSEYSKEFSVNYDRLFHQQLVNQIEQIGLFVYRNQLANKTIITKEPIINTQY